MAHIDFATAVRPAPRANNPARILVIDDNPTTREMLVGFFEDQGCAAQAASGADEVRSLLGRAPLSLVVLDAQLDRRDGIDVLREIRAHSDVPVIMVAPSAPHESDRIIGLELGADDYLGEPFNLRELMARARAVLRRQEMGRTFGGGPRTQSGYRFRGWELRCKSRTLLDPTGERVMLTKSEYGLLVAFLAAPRRTLTREQLLHMTRTHEDIYDRSIDVQVLRLRRKLEVEPTQPDLIMTERGVGYWFDAVVEPLF